MNQHLADQVAPYAKVVVALLKGPLDHEDKLWSELLYHQLPIRDYLAQMGLELILHKEDGYALLSQVALDEEGRTIGMIRRMPLGFEISVICVLLRELLEEFELDATATRSRDRFISHQELKEQIELFLGEKRDQLRFLKELDRYIERVVKLGFLKIAHPNDQLNKQMYVIRRIIKARITVDELVEFREKLNTYVESL